MGARRKSRIDGDVQVAIDELALKGWGPTQIYKQLERQPEFAGRVPTSRTIQRRVNELALRDSSGPWSLADAKDDEAALVLPVLAAVIEGTEAQRVYVTQAEAERIVRIRRAVPDLLPTLDLMLLARVYLLREQQGMSTTDLDAFLAFAPWRSEDARERYRQALHFGWIKPGPAYLAMTTRVIERAIREQDKQEVQHLRNEMEGDSGSQR